MFHGTFGQRQMEKKKRVFLEEVVGNSGWISKKTAVQLNLIILVTRMVSFLSGAERYSINR